MIEEISTDEVADLLDADQRVRVVDIRSPAAYRRGHIPGSENVPFPELTRRVEDLVGADHVVTVCPHGVDSVKAARLIDSCEGIDDDTPVVSMAGGLAKWDGELVDGVEDAGDAADGGPAAPF